MGIMIFVKQECDNCKGSGTVVHAKNAEGYLVWADEHHYSERITLRLLLQRGITDLRIEEQECPACQGKGETDVFLTLTQLREALELNFLSDESPP